ncbi:prepilin peptidase [Phenylobacterium sp.]|uniref:A24 family peptidase n=1 Tax=Phenylobacterium sp. TaxID=1871053 RepID=UPI0035B1EEB7
MQQILLAGGLAAAMAGLMWAGVSDLRRYRIPNRACGLVAGSYLLAAAGLPLGTWLAGAAAGFALLLVGVALFSRGWVGGGDVKLAAAAALWAGPGLLSNFAVVTAVSGAALAAVLLSPARRFFPRPPEPVAQDFRQPMPFGVPLALGGACVCVVRLAPLLQGA